ncbi:MAG: NapC/NirT family cytochrome c [Desulfovibrio sp.]|nr:NapC/NirT family cytochrome c [Desulfovibrio sp.]
MAKPEKRPWLKIFLGGVVTGAVLLVVSAYAMLCTDQRQFCSVCHIMSEAAVTHKLGTHADRSCNDCHAPHNWLVKIPFKAQAGIEDFLGNLMGKDVPSMPSKTTRDMVNANCIACHTQVNTNVASMAAKPYCVDCHRNLAHMRYQPIAKRTVSYE